MLIGTYKDYREYLKDELGRRAQLNRQYSLRAFARDLEISPQVLSLVMSGKKNISPDVAISIAHRLRLSAEEISYLNDLVELNQAKSDALREVVRYRLSRYEANQNFRTLQEDVFAIISDWHHYAILELTFTDSFQNDPIWIAKRLSISPTEVRQAIERLIRLELLEDKNGALVKTEVNISTTQDIPSAGARKLASQLLEKASEALGEQAIEDRDFGSITMAIDPKKLPKAKIMIRKFRRDLMTFLETGKRTEVFVLATQLFKLSNDSNKRSST